MQVHLVFIFCEKVQKFLRLSGTPPQRSMPPTILFFIVQRKKKFIIDLAWQEIHKDFFENYTTLVEGTYS